MIEIPIWLFCLLILLSIGGLVTAYTLVRMAYTAWLTTKQLEVDK